MLLVNGSVCVAKECEIFSRTRFSVPGECVRESATMMNSGSERVSRACDVTEVLFKSLEPHETCAQGVCVGEKHVWRVSLTSHMTTTEQDNDTSTRNHAKHEVNTHSTPVPTMVGRLWGGPTALSTFNQHLRSSCGALAAQVPSEFFLCNV